MMNRLYLILAALMLLCLAPMPYGYFQIVRLFSTIAFGLMTFQYYKEGKEKLAYTFGTLLAIGLIVLFFWEWKNRAKAERGNHPVSPDNSIKVDVVEDNRIEFKLEGKLSPKELIYVASEEDKELTDLFENKPEVFEGWGQMMGFHIVYLPLLMKKLANKDVLQYRAPYLSEAEVASTAIGNDFLLQYLEHPGEKGRIKHGFIRTEDIHRGGDGKDKAINRFYPLSSNSGEPIADQLHKIGKQISFEKSQHEKLLEYRNFDDFGNIPNISEADAHFNSQIMKIQTI